MIEKSTMIVQKEYPEKLVKYLVQIKETKKIGKTCEHCCNVFYVDTWNKTARFCSKSCATKHRHINNPNHVNHSMNVRSCS